MEKMFSAFTGQPLEKVQEYTDRDSFLSVSEVRWTVFFFCNCEIRSYCDRERFLKESKMFSFQKEMNFYDC
jgi:hypothetical protein